jgi:hypothetical protein
VHQVAAVENGHAGEIFHGAVHQIKVGAHAANTEVGVKAGQYRVGVRYLRQVGVIACHYASIINEREIWQVALQSGQSRLRLRVEIDHEMPHLSIIGYAQQTSNSEHSRSWLTGFLKIAVAPCRLCA